MLRGTIGEAAYTGWISLHVAIVRGDGAGRAINQGGTKIFKVNAAHYLRRTCNLPANLGIHAIGRERYNIESAKAVADLILMCIPAKTRGAPLSEGYALALLDFMEEKARKLGLPGGFDASTPFTALKSSYSVFSRFDTNDLHQLCYAALTLVSFGMAVSALMQLTRCKRCFRWAIPGYELCPEHSSSKESGYSLEARRLNYLRGVRVSESPFRSPPRMRKVAGINVRRLPRVIARLLWGTPLPNEERTATLIRNTVRSNPDVWPLLGYDCADLQGGALYDRLNERLDRYEFNPSAWVPKIKFLDKWLRHEALMLPGRRGDGVRKERRIRDATNLAREGFIQADIAMSLGIRPSTISNWIRRGQAPELQRLLAEGRASPGDRKESFVSRIKRVFAQQLSPSLPATRRKEPR